METFFDFLSRQEDKLSGRGKTSRCVHTAKPTI